MRDRRLSPLAARAWSATLTPDGLEAITRRAASAHDAFHGAMDLIEALAQYGGVAICTMHTLNGDPAAWATLATREGFLDCAPDDHTLADLSTDA